MIAQATAARTLAPAPTIAFARGPAAFRALADDWRVLAAPAHPFVSPEWLGLLARLEGVCGEVLTARGEGGRLLAALPLCRRGRTLAALANDHTPRFDLVGDPAALGALWTRLAADTSWDVLILREVPADSPLATELPARARARGFLVALRPGACSPYFPLQGFEAALSAKFRANLRRRKKSLDGVTFERVARADPQALADGLALEAAGWKGDAGTAIACDAALRGFYTAIARTFGRRGQLSLAFLRAGGRRIAFQFALEDERAYYLLKPGFDPAFARFGPGQLLTWEAALDAARRGLREFDFLGWDMPWKRDWTSATRPHVTVAIHRPTLRGRLQHTARDVLRPRARSFLVRLRQVWT